jgi:hypothetical protein
MKRGWLRSAIVFAIVAWLGWIVATATTSYFTMLRVVEESIAFHLPRGVARAVVSGAPALPLDAIRHRIGQNARAEGLALDDRKLLVAQDGDAVRVALKWSHPVIGGDNNVFLAVPLSLDQSFRRAR